MGLYIDSHAHLDAEEFAPDREEVLARAREAGISALLTIGTGNPRLAEQGHALNLAAQYDFIYASIGVHPHDAQFFDLDASQYLETLLAQRHPRLLAIGEIGLDYHYDNSPRDLQRGAFANQIRIAIDHQLPLIIHTREAEEDTLSILREERAYLCKGIMHCFSGSHALAEQVLEMGFMISFAGNISFKKSDDLRDVARKIPPRRLLIETDSPYLAPVPLRGKRNEPSFIQHTAKHLGALHDMTGEEMGRITTENFLRFFHLDESVPIAS